MSSIYFNVTTFLELFFFFKNVTDMALKYDLGLMVIGVLSFSSVVNLVLTVLLNCVWLHQPTVNLLLV